MVTNPDGTVTLNRANGTVYEEGTPLNAKTLNEYQDFMFGTIQNSKSNFDDVSNFLDCKKQTVFNPDGSISENWVSRLDDSKNVAERNTIFNANGSISEVQRWYLPPKHFEKLTAFREDGSIAEVVTDYMIRNKIYDGSFELGEWVLGSGFSYDVNNKLKDSRSVKGVNNPTTNVNITVDVTPNHEYYFGVWCDLAGGTTKFELGTLYTENIVKTVGGFNFFSVKVKPTTNSLQIKLYGSTNSVNWDCTTLINLTENFGGGLEPTKEQMDFSILGDYEGYIKPEEVLVNKITYSNLNVEPNTTYYLAGVPSGTATLSVNELDTSTKMGNIQNNGSNVQQSVIFKTPNIYTANVAKTGTWDKVSLVNLTQVYGAGNEPRKVDLDDRLEFKMDSFIPNVSLEPKKVVYNELTDGGFEHGAWTINAYNTGSSVTTTSPKFGTKMLEATNAGLGNYSELNVMLEPNQNYYFSFWINKTTGGNVKVSIGNCFSETYANIAEGWTFYSYIFNSGTDSIVTLRAYGSDTVICPRVQYDGFTLIKLSSNFTEEPQQNTIDDLIKNRYEGRVDSI